MDFNNENDNLEENIVDVEDEFTEEENDINSPEDKIKDLNNKTKEEIEKIKSELEAYKDRFLRTTAEYDNFRKRTEKEKLSTYMNATSKAILTILPVADSLELAEKACEGGSEEYKKGLSMVKSQFNESLKILGVEAFGKVGDKFNPDIHNAVSHINDENDEENIISEVFQKGYMLKDRVIRHAMVQVTN